MFNSAQALYSIDGAKRCVMAGPGADAGPCDEAVACKTVDNAIDNGHAQWLELYVEDAVGYPDAGTYAHNRLVNGAPRGPCP